MLLKCKLCGKEIPDDEGYYEALVRKSGDVITSDYHKTCLTQMTVAEFGAYFDFDVIHNLENADIGISFFEGFPQKRLKKWFS